MIVFTLIDGEPSEFTIDEETGVTTPPIDEGELNRLEISREVSPETYLKMMLLYVADPLDMNHDLGNQFIRLYAECRVVPIIERVNEWFEGYIELLPSGGVLRTSQQDLIWAFTLERSRHRERQAAEREVRPGDRTYTH